MWNLSPVGPWKNNLTQFNNVLDWMELIDNVECNDLSDLSKAILNCWQIWNDRNNKVFRSMILNPARSISIATSVGLSFFKVNCKKISRGDPCHQHPICWHPSLHGYVKLNFDESVSLDRSAAAFVLRNEEGQHVGTGALNLDGATILVAEAIALKEGLLLARHKGVKKLMVEGDSKLVIQVMQDVWMPLWHLKPMIEDIKWLASEFQHIS
ncbi:uncharacterized protein [Pyrus communis]|uniref:uncharacterized protein n=1 Tax=Pyrus communis TaxID=23211 RepID=UPI0035BEDFC6